jgi:glycosyltransferase involved in cell wall biosynthesis
VHVCFVSDFWARPNPTGIGVYLDRVLEHVPAAAPAATFTALGFAEGGQPPVPPSKRLRYVQVPGNTKASYLRWWVRGAAADIATRVGDVSVTHALHPLPSSARGPWAVTVHDISPILFPEQYTPRNRWRFRAGINATVRRGAHVIAISQTTADDIQRIYGLPDSRISVVRYGIDAERAVLDDDARAALTARYKLPPRFMLFVGELNRRKNLVTLVRAFAKVAAQLPDVDLVLAGADGLGADELRAAIAAERVVDRVHLPGYAGHADALGLMTMSEAFVFPSKYEGFGLPPLEAMVQGTPVVAASGGSVPEIVGDAALLSDPSDVEALSVNLVRVITDSDTRAGLVERGFARAATFTWQRMASEIVAVYERLAG